MENEQVIEACAQASHESNRAYCRAIGDNSQPSWDEAPDWQKSSARNGVIGVLGGNTPAQSHQSWLDEKVAAGWVYGETKDPERKTHPCMVSYDALPEEQRRKDDIYVATVRAMAAGLGVRLTPRTTSGEKLITFRGSVSDLWTDLHDALDHLELEALSAFCRGMFPDQTVSITPRDASTAERDVDPMERARKMLRASTDALYALAGQNSDQRTRFEAAKELRDMFVDVVAEGNEARASSLLGIPLRDHQAREVLYQRAEDVIMSMGKDGEILKGHATELAQNIVNALLVRRG